MKDDSVELRKDRFFFRKRCAYCGSRDTLELDAVRPYTWIDESVWKLPDYKFDRLFLEGIAQVLCNPCLLRKKRLWKSYRKEGGDWLKPYLEDL